MQYNELGMNNDGNSSGLGKQSICSWIPGLAAPMPQGNSDPVELLSNVPPQLFYIHQLRIMPNPREANISSVNTQ